MKNSFIYYLDWAEGLLKLPEELRLKIDDAVKRYVLYGEEPTDREVLYSMFALMRMQIDRDAEKWDKVREKRSVAGARGAIVTNQQKSAKSANDGKCQQMPTNADKCQQESANSAVNVNVNDNVNVIDNNNVNNNLNKDTKVSSSLEPVDYKEIVEFYNEKTAGKAMPQCQKLTEKRKQAVKARIKEFGKERILLAITKAADSVFLNGRNDRNYVADFDFVFRASKMVSILEGKYDDYRYGTDRTDSNTSAEQRRLESYADVAAEFRSQSNSDQVRE